MIAILFSIIALVLINLGFGFFLNRIFNFNNQKFSIFLLLGICSIVFIQTLLAFFIPINQYVEGAFIVVGLSLVFYYRKQIGKLNFLFLKNWSFYIFGLVLALIASFMPFLPDHFTYYNPTINYISQYGFIKGISNIDLFLGQSSLWHVYGAGFSHFVDPFMKINTFMLLVFLMFIFEFKKYFLLVVFPFLLLFTPQPSPDLSVFVITLVVVTSLFYSLVSKPILFLLAVLAFCIKITIFWLPLFLVVDLIINRQINKKVLLFSASFVVILICKNLYVFGYPFFPMSFFDSNLPWKANLALLQYSSETGVVLSFGENYRYDEIMSLSFLERIFLWFSFGFKSITHFGLIMSFLVVLVYTIRKKSRLWTILLFCILLKVVLVIYLSSQFRFYVDVYFVAFVIVANTFRPKLIFGISFGLMALVALLFFNTDRLKQFSNDYYLVTYLPQFYKDQILKPREWEAQKHLTEQTIGNFSFYPIHHYIYKQPINTISLRNLKLYFHFGFFPQQLGDDFKDGFYQRKLSPLEKSQLEEIIKEAKFKD